MRLLLAAAATLAVTLNKGEVPADAQELLQANDEPTIDDALVENGFDLKMQALANRKAIGILIHFVRQYCSTGYNRHSTACRKVKASL